MQQPQHTLHGFSVGDSVMIVPGQSGCSTFYSTVTQVGRCSLRIKPVAETDGCTPPHIFVWSTKTGEQLFQLWLIGPAEVQIGPD